MNKLVINAKDFVLGASETDFYSDGGYSPEDKGANINAVKGLLYPQMLLTAKEGTVYKGIAICYGRKAAEITINNALMGANPDNDDGYFYLVDSAGIGTQAATDDGRDYKAGKGDIIFFKDNFYATSTTDVALLGYDLVTGSDYDWWHDTKGNTSLNSYCNHPLLVLDDVLYIGDANKVHTWDGSTDTEAFLTLPLEEIITAMIVYNYKIYIATEPYYNYGGDYHVSGKIYEWDGTSSQWDNVYELGDKVNAFYVFKGQLYLFTPRFFARWNGISFIKLRDVSTNIYKQQITDYQDYLFYAEGKTLVCFDGQYFSYPYSNLNSSTLLAKDIDLITAGYQNYLFLNTNNANYSTTTTSGTGVSYWRANRYSFGQNCYIRKLIVELQTPLVSGSEIEFYFYDHNGTSKTIGTMTYATDGAVSIKEFKNINIKTYSIQPRVYFKVNGKPIRQLTVEYEPTEQPGRTS